MPSTLNSTLISIARISAIYQVSGESRIASYSDTLTIDWSTITSYPKALHLPRILFYHDVLGVFYTWSKNLHVTSSGDSLQIIIQSLGMTRGTGDVIFNESSCIEFVEYNGGIVLRISSVCKEAGEFLLNRLKMVEGMRVR
jgi:hypothetical protein